VTDANHDIITVGGSAGALEVLLELVRELPRDVIREILLHEAASSIPKPSAIT
jgi:hypothetical protein